jgi:hypothetical protein
VAAAPLLVLDLVEEEVLVVLLVFLQLVDQLLILGDTDIMFLMDQVQVVF